MSDMGDLRPEIEEERGNLVKIRQCLQDGNLEMAKQLKIQTFEAIKGIFWRQSQLREDSGYSKYPNGNPILKINDEALRRLKEEREKLIEEHPELNS
jgi:hypothetical protein